ncbi:MAG: HAD hydrolase-like protein [Actinomycetaceae bacterium]|nr:HAD hydrolase-like protein [Arcanobacterium sp.]MDD7686996.1 HAD hydrolase-like protein [Actinomycetaceae bacterium]MDY5273348.1 HAD hydrolase-like protein [Arcanobacterium sp.]
MKSEKSKKKAKAHKSEKDKKSARKADIAAQASVEIPLMVRDSPQRVYDAYIMNLSGTLFNGDLLMPGVDKVLAALDVMRRPVVFMSSDSHTSPDSYQTLLANFGMDVDLDQIFTPVRVVNEYLSYNFPDAHVMAIGDSEFLAHMAKGGIALTDDPQLTDVVVVAHDREFSFTKLNLAYQAIVGPKKAKLVVTSMVRTWLTADGSSEPGTRAIVRAIQSATGAQIYCNLGAPERPFLDCVFRYLDSEPHKTLVVSDSLSTDIRMARGYGVPTALVLTGEGSIVQAELAAPKDQPNFVVNSVVDVVPHYIVDQL